MTDVKPKPEMQAVELIGGPSNGQKVNVYLGANEVRVVHIEPPRRVLEISVTSTKLPMPKYHRYHRVTDSVFTYSGLY